MRLLPAGAGAAAVVLLGLIACAGGGDPDRLVAPPAADVGSDAMIDRDWSVRLDTARRLVVSLTGAPPGDGPCGSRLRAVAREDGDVVRLSVVDEARSTAPADGGPVVCPAIGHLWSLPVELDRDLGTRSVVDAAGRAVRLADPLVPGRLPEGYALGAESGGPDQHLLRYASPGGGQLLVATSDDDRAAGALPQVGERVVDGRRFRLLELGPQRIVAFEVGGRTAWVSWLPPGDDGTDPALSFDELLDVAVSVR